MALQTTGTAERQPAAGATERGKLTHIPSGNENAADSGTAGDKFNAIINTIIKI
jgi:hypothetical protein